MQHRLPHTTSADEASSPSPLRRRLTAVALGVALSAGLAIPAGAATADVEPAPTRPAPSEIRPEVRPDAEDRLEVLTMTCRNWGGTDGNAAGCAWRPASHPDAVGYQLWRIVDGSERELVWRGRLDETRHIDRVPEDASYAVYAVLAVDADGDIVGQARPDVVRFASSEGRTDRPARSIGR